jgi:hypothetical protein
MPVPSPATEAQLVSTARKLIQALVEELRNQPDLDADAMCSRAAAAADRYATELLAEFVAATHPMAAEDLEWLKRRYLTLILEFATAVCGVIPDSFIRHSVVQRLQCKILEQERHLRTILNSVAASQPSTIAAGIQPGGAAFVAAPRTAQSTDQDERE